MIVALEFAGVCDGHSLGQFSYASAVVGYVQVLLSKQTHAETPQHPGVTENC